jgi:hypothetical protein
LACLLLGIGSAAEGEGVTLAFSDMSDFFDEIFRSA